LNPGSVRVAMVCMTLLLLAALGPASAQSRGPRGDGSKIVYRKDPGDLYFIGVDGTQEGRFIHGADSDWTQ